MTPEQFDALMEVLRGIRSGVAITFGCLIFIAALIGIRGPWKKP